MEERTYSLICNAINWLKNPCATDEVKIQEALDSLKSIPEMKWFYSQLYENK